MSSSRSEQQVPPRPRRLSKTAALITSVLVVVAGGLQAAEAESATVAASDATQGASSGLAQLRPRPTATPKPSVTATPSPSPTRTATPTASSTQSATSAPSPSLTAWPTPAPSGCTVVIFNAQSYCTGTLTGVNRTAYGLGQRIALGGVNVSVVDDQNRTVQVWGFDPCPAGLYCGAGSITTTVVWDASPMPTAGDVISVYGVTAASSLRVDGSVKIGWCHPDWGC